MQQGGNAGQGQGAMLCLSFDRGTLTLAGISRRSTAKLEDCAPWVWDGRVAKWRCDAIHYAAVVSRVRQAGLQLRDGVPRWRAVRWPCVDVPDLRPEQQAACARWLESRRGCIVMPTGTGKTEVAFSLMASLATSTLVVAPVRDLMYQWQRRIGDRLGYDAGIVGDRLRRIRPVTVTTYDSAYLHMDTLGGLFELVVFDECHHLPGPARRDAAIMSAAPLRLGLTATLERSDGRHADLEWLIGPTVYEVPVAAVRGQTLADYEAVRIPVHLAAEEQARYDACARTVRGYLALRRKEDPRYGWQQLCAESSGQLAARRALAAYLVKKAIEDRAVEKLRVLEDLFRLHAGEPCLVFTGSNAMARDVCLRFLIPCLLSHSGRKERQDALRGLAEGRYPALVANRVLDEGVDVPEVKVAIVVGGQSCIRQAKQRLGRVLRKRGNARATLYEVVCQETSESRRAQRRCRSDAYQGLRVRRMAD